MNKKGNSKMNFVMEKVMSNEEPKYTKTNVAQNSDKTNLDNYSIPPTCTEDSLSAFSNLSISIPEELSNLKNRKMKAMAEGSTRSFHHKSRDVDTISERAESIYNLEKSVKKPITGKVTEISTTPPQSNSVSKTDNRDKVASNDKEDELLKTEKIEELPCDIKIPDTVRPQPEIKRNPITGDGIDPTFFPSNIKNYKRSGIRINQPPGGISKVILS